MVASPPTNCDVPSINLTRICVCWPQFCGGGPPDGARDREPLSRHASSLFLSLLFVESCYLFRMVFHPQQPEYEPEARNGDKDVDDYVFHKKRMD